MRGYFKMVHFAIRQFNITAVLIILQTGNIRNAMSTGKEAHLLINIAHSNIHLIKLLSIISHDRNIALEPSGVFQLTTVNRHLLRQVNNSIRRDAVIPEMLFGITDLCIPETLLYSQHK